MKRLDAFQLLCNCLGSYINPEKTTDRIRRRLLRGDGEWRSLVELANRHLLCPALYAGLDHIQLLSCIPPELCQYLGTLYERNGERNRQLMALAYETVMYLNEIDVEPVLLKGTANLFSGLYPDQNMRFLCDIDLLVPADRMIDCVSKLHVAGYDLLLEPENASFKRHFHYPPLLKKNEYIRIELHEELVQKKYRKMLDAENVMLDSTLFPIGKAHARMPSVDHRLIHNVIHAQLTDKGFSWGDIQLRQLFDFVLLATALGKEANWSRIAQRFQGSDSNALSGYLLAGNRFFGHPLPTEIQATMSARAYLAWLCIQINHLWLMRVGSMRRVALFYRDRLRNCIESRKVPQFWDRDFRWRHNHLIISMLSKNW